MGHKVYKKSLYYCGTQLRLSETKKSDMPWGLGLIGNRLGTREGRTAPRVRVGVLS